jgi:hypothetical protein
VKETPRPSSAFPRNPTELRDHLVPPDARKIRFPHKPPNWHGDSATQHWFNPPSIGTLSLPRAHNMDSASRWLLSCYHPVARFLSIPETHILHEAYPALDPMTADAPLPPMRPYLQQRHYGFGKERIGLNSSTSTTNPYLLLHFAYDCLDPGDRHVVLKAVPYWQAYINMRRKATYTSIGNLRAPQQVAHLNPTADNKRAYKMALALLQIPRSDSVARRCLHIRLLALGRGQGYSRLSLQ